RAAATKTRPSAPPEAAGCRAKSTGRVGEPKTPRIGSDHLPNHSVRPGKHNPSLERTCHERWARLRDRRREKTAAGGRHNGERRTSASNGPGPRLPPNNERPAPAPCREPASSRSPIERECPGCDREPRAIDFWRR